VLKITFLLDVLFVLLCTTLLCRVDGLRRLGDVLLELGDLRNVRAQAAI
jgi:hypothetical protein